MFDKILSLLGGNLFTGVAEIVGKFVTDPTKAAELHAELAKLEAATKVQLEGLAVQDRNSARQREMEVKDATPSRLAYLIVGSFIAVAIFVVAHPYIWPGTKLEPEMLGMVGAVVGYLSAKAEQVASYYFGSSAGSQAKDLTIHKMMGGAK